MTVKNWNFHCERPHEGADGVATQMRLAHDYRNRLVALELQRREEDRAWCASFEPQVAVLEEQERTAKQLVEDAVNEVLNQNRQSRKKTGTPAQKEVIREAKCTLRQVRAQLKEARNAARTNESAQEARTALKEANYARVREARATMSAAGLYWGVYLSVEAAAESFAKGAPPKFRQARQGLPVRVVGDDWIEYASDGRVSVQIQHGMTWEQALLCKDSRFRIEMVERKCHPKFPAQPGSKRSQQKLQAVAWVRIGSDGRTPIWAKVLVRLHRQPDPLSRIKWAHILRNIVGSTIEWQLMLTMAVPEENKCTGHGRVAINPGWAIVPDGLRVATWVGEDGRSGHWVLPSRHVSRWKHADSLQEISDRAFNEVRDILVDWLETATVPAWLVEQLGCLPQWKSHRRLCAVLLLWAQRRFDGDETIFAELQKWRAQDKHLADYKCHSMLHATHQRQYMFRQLAAQLRTEYDTVVMGKVGQWRDLAKRPAVESDDPLIATQRYNQRIASPGALEATMTHSDMAVIRLNSANATRICTACGSLEEFDASLSRLHTCSACGVTEDQDIRHCKNMLARAESEAAVLIEGV